MNSTLLKFAKPLLGLFVLAIALAACSTPKEKIVLKDIRDVVVDANTDPRLKANAIFYNPNKEQGKLKGIHVDIFINGKKAGVVNQDLKVKIPSRAEFTVPLEVELAIKELGFMNTLMGVLGGKTFQVKYEGNLRVTYHGVPIRIPVNHTDEVKIRF
ncbi:LEA type 2 family protein [Pseudochryseolinea flava]|nr:LEA type 2 family protein [Pseudochryseolinea flava]